VKLNWAERWVVNNPLRVLEQRLEIRRLKGMMSLKPGATALEVGCGRGAGAHLILQEFQLAQVYAMDLDVRMVRKAQDYLALRSEGQVRLFVGNVFRLPLNPESMDAVFGFGVLHHVVDWRVALSEIARVLKPGGVYYLEELYPALYQNFLARRILLHPAEDRFRSQDLRQALQQAALPLKRTLEIKSLGILGVAEKEGGTGGSVSLDGKGQLGAKPANDGDQG
jgi:ubiquinone/menaquinone biosynthesis C-methylase UbiE